MCAEEVFKGGWDSGTDGGALSNYSVEEVFSQFREYFDSVSYTRLIVEGYFHQSHYINEKYLLEERIVYGLFVIIGFSD